MSTPPIANCCVEVHVELGVDRERQGLRDALQAAREHDRRSELPQPAREREREAGDQPAAGERQHYPEEGAHGAGAEGTRGGRQLRARSPQKQAIACRM